LDDIFSLADAGEIEYDIVMDISVYLIEEYQVLSWAVAKSKLMMMHTLLTSTTEPFIANMFQAIYQSNNYFPMPLRMLFLYIHF